MTHRPLLLGLLLSLAAHAAETEIIDEKVLEPQMKELHGRMEQVQKNSLKIDDLVVYYQQQSVAKGTPRQRAINAYMYGYVLMRVLPPSRVDSKDAKREFQRALDLVPGFLPALADLALIAESTGDTTEADNLLRRALRFEPAYVRAHLQLGQMALRSGDLERAQKIYEHTLEIEPTVQAFSALIAVYLGLFRKTHDDKEKERCAKKALAAAEAVTTLEPDNQLLRLFKAEVFLNLGRMQDAIDYLENLHAAGNLKQDLQLKLLGYLRQVYQAKGDVDGVKRTVERLLKCDNLRPEERARISNRLKDLDTMGRNAFLKWGIEDAVQTLHNEGLSVEDRLANLRGLWEFILGDAIDVAELRPLVKLAWDECFRTLVDGPPELVVMQLRALRNGMPPSPRLMAVLVHFVYPEGRTPEIRAEGVRTIAALTGALAIPALYYTLQDDSGAVVREADSQLAMLCERRSPLGGGIEPYTPEQRRQALRFWTGYFHSEDGAGRLAKSFGALGEAIVKVKPDRTSAPMIDHAAHVLLDDDVPWAGWAASYDFLVRYWGKEFRPVERRGKPVEPFEREAVAKAFDEEFKGGGPAQNPNAPGPVPPPQPKGMAPKQGN
jgi:tetratricopeptide (TPR) repeat protein